MRLALVLMKVLHETCTGIDESFQHHSFINIVYCITIVSQILLPSNGLHNNCDIFYDKIDLIFFINTIAKPLVERLIVVFEPQ